MKVLAFASGVLVIVIIIGGIIPLIYNIYVTEYYVTAARQLIRNTNIFTEWISVTKQPTKDNQDGRLTHAEVGQRFARRLHRLKEACQKYRNSSMFRSLGRKVNRGSVGPYWPVMNVSGGYCGIEKTASTTWYGLFGTLKRKMAGLGIKKTYNFSNAREVMFVFVRDPYSRLVSAYTDKLFCPNTLFWGIGRYIIKNFRPNASQHSLICGHDVTFPEFIRYVIHSQKTGQFRNGHFVPVHDHCSLCNESYDYIGYLETLSEDMPYLLEVIQSPVNYSKNFDSHTLYDNANWVLKTMTPKIRKCMTMKEACLRLWKKWHVRGIISKAEPLPVSAEQAEVISAEDFVNLSLRALARSGPKSVRKAQKREALQEAFASVPIQDRLTLQQLLFLNFELFDFDPRPETVFPNSNDKHPDGNNYRYYDLQV